MCVTNTTHRRVAAISLNQSQLLNGGMLSQRLLGGLAAPAAAASVPAQMVSTYMPPAEKTRPKRRRKPQKPGKTAKMNDRHFVVHNYHDHADDVVEAEPTEQTRRGGVAVAFPVKLHAVLDQVERDGLGHVISWQPHGRCFVIHRPKDFVDYVMPRYFRQSKLTSFQRQLNLYGFSRLTRGPDAGGYYHELFLRSRVGLCQRMQRTKVKGTKFKAASSPDQEPDFYSMKPVVSPATSEDEGSMSTAPVAMPRAVDPLPLYEMPAPVPPLSQPVQTGLTDQVFDEAVNELFMEDFCDPALSDFVNDWDPTASVEPDIADDNQLGLLLEKLLE